MSTKVKKKYQLTIRQKKFEVIADKVLFFRLLQKLHGRFWGVTAVIGMVVGMTICFLILPDKQHISTAFSDFGNDVKTAPFFAGSMFFAAYGLWRWRNYLSRTLKRSGIIIVLITCTIVGLYLVALMPVGWKPIPYKLHIFGVTLAGVSMVLTVIVDGLLTKTKTHRHALSSRFFRLVSVISILVGGYITYGSLDVVGWFDLALLGESLILAGYAIWVIMKTYQGEGARSRISYLIQKIVIVK